VPQLKEIALKKGQYILCGRYTDIYIARVKGHGYRHPLYNDKTSTSGIMEQFIKKSSSLTLRIVSPNHEAPN
jgi:hypothetical protein